MGPELWAALVGALVAGVIGVLTQYIVIWDNNRRRDREHRDVQIALARSVVIKTIRIQGSFHVQLKYIFDGTKTAKAANTMRYAAIRPLANLPEAVEFNADELALVSSIGEGEYLDEFLSLDTRHNSLLQLWTLYETNRKHLEASLGPASFEGAIGTVVLTREKYQEVEGAMQALDDLLNQMEAMIWDYHKETTSMLEKLISGINKKFGTRLRMEMKERQQTEVAHFREVLDGLPTGSPKG